MSYTVILTAEARQDVLYAYSYYENLRIGLGEELLAILEEYYAVLSQNPYLYSYTDKLKTIRDVAIPRFPYVLIYEIIDKKVIIYTVHNTHKNLPAND